ncbi:hypothetical protein BpHYR1_019487 [Brachionus plicatilis]|uniref:Uncharacterized protein n=1 Tax=Brachionus plicatilis TaxID=10195 RepID=A0A3M7RCA6_BRAPC|nr:hypothetical protein BpHYR1_019487 [Brachionus plicatilis]
MAKKVLFSRLKEKQRNIFDVFQNVTIMKSGSIKNIVWLRSYYNMLKIIFIHIETIRIFFHQLFKVVFWNESQNQSNFVRELISMVCYSLIDEFLELVATSRNLSSKSLYGHIVVEYESVLSANA